MTQRCWNHDKCGNDAVVVDEHYNFTCIPCLRSGLDLMSEDFSYYSPFIENEFYVHGIPKKCYHCGSEEFTEEIVDGFMDHEDGEVFICEGAIICSNCHKEVGYIKDGEFKMDHMDEYLEMVYEESDE